VDEAEKKAFDYIETLKQQIKEKFERMRFLLSSK